MPMTMVEKILAKACGLPAVNAGDVVEPSVDLAMSHENAALVVNQFQEIYKGTGLEAKVWDPAKIAIIFDHRVPAESSKTATNQKKVRGFVAAQGITKFHDIRGDEGGICHQILPENGYVRPGAVVVGTDSHTTSHGALGAFAFLLALTPPDQAGRSFATYGGVYIAASLLWMWAVEGARPDRWDLIGAGLALAGAAVILWGPRG